MSQQHPLQVQQGMLGRRLAFIVQYSAHKKELNKSELFRVEKEIEAAEFKSKQNMLTEGLRKLTT